MNPYNKPYRPPPKPAIPVTGPSPEYMAKVLGIKRVRSTTPAITTPGTKRRATPKPDHDEDEEEEAGMEKQPRKKKAKGEEPEERRLRRFRQKAPVSFNDRLVRVRTQRMFLIERNRTFAADGTHQEETFDIAGSTGNVYQVLISKVPSCSCPDAKFKGNQCKHIIYVMVNILKAREKLSYQLALLTTELNEIFASAPITQQAITSSPETSLSTDTGGARKSIEGDCPVCVMPFEEGEDLVWCKAACGQNVHRTCFEQWQRSKPGQQAKCVYCRSLWKGEVKDVSKISKEGVKNHEGYVNVAGDLGISQERDMSTYHPFWVAQQQGYSYGSSSSRRRRRRDYDDEDDGYGSVDDY